MRRFIKIDNNYIEVIFENEKIFFNKNSIANTIKPSPYFISKSEILISNSDTNVFLEKYSMDKKRKEPLDIYCLDKENSFIFRLKGLIISSVTYINDSFLTKIEFYSDYNEYIDDTSDFLTNLTKHIRDKRIEELGIK